jgi:uncharacterized protein YutE (UPF0331/DUF86 family)
MTINTIPYKEQNKTMSRILSQIRKHRIPESWDRKDIEEMIVMIAGQEVVDLVMRYVDDLGGSGSKPDG